MTKHIANIVGADSISALIYKTNAELARRYKKE